MLNLGLQKMQHPLSPSLALPEVLEAAVRFTTAQGFSAVARCRVEFFKHWNARARALELEEKRLRSSMDSCVNRAVSGKRLALFAAMLSFYGYPDPGVVDELVKGASLTGDVPETGMLPLKFTPAVLTVDALKIHSSLRRNHLFSQAKGSGNAEVDMEVWRQTIEERDKGWLRGPIELSEIPEGAPISRRFGLLQKHMVRLIDDYSESSVNDTVNVYEAPVLRTVDVACAVLAYWFSSAKETKTDAKLLARTFDLSSTYRRVGLSEQGREVSYIQVCNPEKDCMMVFQALVLPFGAIKSLHSFLRLARAIWWLGVVGCKLLWSSFFDDYIVFSPPALSKSSELAAAALFKIRVGFLQKTEDNANHLM